jgi:hypothetical protein
VSEENGTADTLAVLRAELELRCRSYYESVAKYVEAGGDPGEAMTIGLPDEIKQQMPGLEMLGMLMGQ